MMKVTYLGHSGFLVEVEDAYFLFDFYKGELPPMDSKKKVLVFVSHSHYDHYKNDIFDIKECFPVIHFVLSSDVFTRETENVTFLRPNEDDTVLGCRIRTLRSTDAGVAFLLRYRGRTIYHAGDLNWWHWEGESPEYNTGMRRAYQSEINKLQSEHINVAFVPVDPRLGESYCLGLDCFMKRTVTDYVFPMHFWDNYSVFTRLELEECTKEYEHKIMKIQREGQAFLLEK